MTRELIDRLQRFRDQLSRKPEDDRTKREELIIETSKTLEELLRKYAGAAGDGASQHRDDSVLTVIRSYNEINRDYDLMDADLQVASAMRKGRGHGTK